MESDVRYHSSSGFCGGGTGGKLSLSTSSLSLCRWASLLSIIFWVKSTRNRPSVSSSSVLQENLMVTSSKIFSTHCIRSIQTLLTWEVSFCHLFVKLGLFFQLASITKEKKELRRSCSTIYSQRFSIYVCWTHFEFSKLFCSSASCSASFSALAETPGFCLLQIFGF